MQVLGVLLAVIQLARQTDLPGPESPPKRHRGTPRFGSFPLCCGVQSKVDVSYLPSNRENRWLSNCGLRCHVFLRHRWQFAIGSVSLHVPSVWKAISANSLVSLLQQPFPAYYRAGELEEGPLKVVAASTAASFPSLALRYCWLRAWRLERQVIPLQPSQASKREERWWSITCYFQISYGKIGTLQLASVSPACAIVAALL